MSGYMAYLSGIIPEKDSLKLVKSEAKAYYKTHAAEECYKMGMELYKSDNFQIQEVGVFLLGYSAHEYKNALSFMKDTVSLNESWKVQEILAMTFDVRRAASEGLRVWTSRDYFKDNPKTAIELLAANREDESEYVRKSVGNAIRDISKKFPDLVSEEINSWDQKSKRCGQVYKLATKFLFNK